MQYPFKYIAVYILGFVVSSCCGEGDRIPSRFYSQFNKEIKKDVCIADLDIVERGVSKGYNR